MVKIICLLGTILFLSWTVSFADGLRCGNRVVSIGESKIEIMGKCGSPDDSEIISYDSKGKISQSGSVDLNTGAMTSSGNVSLSNKKVENLYYNCGEGRFIYVLTFIDGKLKTIKSTGSYGSGPSKCE